jgi:two-component system, OmpR family, KDP operon response regulator KdpE
MSRILLIEDDPALRGSVASMLTRNGHQLTAVADGVAGMQALLADHYDVLLLDIGLPFVDGWRILDSLPERRTLWVIVISARGEEGDKVRALDLGADDYLAKPFGADELLARIRAVERRAQSGPGPALVATAADVVVDLGAHTVLRSGSEVRLSPTEYGLLSELARHRGEVVDHRTLLSEVWGPSYSYQRNYLRTFIQRLRSKLEQDPRSPRVIITAGSRGYRFGAPPHREGD